MSVFRFGTAPAYLSADKLKGEHLYETRIVQDKLSVSAHVSSLGLAEWTVSYLYNPQNDQHNDVLIVAIELLILGYCVRYLQVTSNNW